MPVFPAALAHAAELTPLNLSLRALAPFALVFFSLVFSTLTDRALPEVVAVPSILAHVATATLPECISFHDPLGLSDSVCDDWTLPLKLAALVLPPGFL